GPPALTRASPLPKAVATGVAGTWLRPGSGSNRVSKQGGQSRGAEFERAAARANGRCLGHARDEKRRAIATKSSSARHGMSCQRPQLFESARDERPKPKQRV